MKTTIGYQISGYDNGCYMTGSGSKLFAELKDIPKCEACGYRTDYRYTNKDFKFRRKKLDFSSTYDGVTIVSQRFKEFCIHHGYSNLVFAELPKAVGFFQFYIKGNVLLFSAGLKEKLCKKCGQYESVVGPAIIAHNITEPLSDGFYQSDLWFASGNEKSPIWLISPTTREKLNKEGFNNICFNKIELNL